MSDGMVAVIVSVAALGLQAWNAWVLASVRNLVISSEVRTLEKVDGKLTDYVLERICVLRSCKIRDCPIRERC